MQIDREQFVQEQLLRKQIRKAIKMVREQKAGDQRSRRLEEKKIRRIVRKLIKETTVGENVPERATGINELERVLEEIIKILEQDYKRLTTSEEQRKSFRVHIINGVTNLLATERATEPSSEEPSAIQEQEIDIDVGEGEDEAFIDVRGETEPEPEPEKTPEEDFGVEGEDKTGRNFAYETFKRVENQIVKGYERLDDQKDKDLFYDYLITNLKLYFDKFEDELQTTISPEPTTPEYEQEKEAETELEPGAEEEAGLDDLDLEL